MMCLLHTLRHSVSNTVMFNVHGIEFSELAVRELSGDFVQMVVEKV